MSPQTPVVNAGLMYVNGFKLDWASDSTLVLEPGACRDSTNINDIVSSVSIVISSNVIGAGGIDLAALVVSSMYGVYVIGDSTGYKETSAVLSLDKDAPVLPFGYDMFRRVGWVSSDATAAPNVKLVKWYQYELGQQRVYYFYDVVKVAATLSNANYAQLILSKGITPTTDAPALPYTATRAILQVTLAAAAIIDFMPYSVLLTSTTPTIGCVELKNGGAAATTWTVEAPVSIDAVQGACVSAKGTADAIYVCGFHDQLVVI